MAIRKKPIQKAITRVGDILAFITGIYILLTGVRIWLLFGTINKALYLYNTEINVQEFATWSTIGSVVIFLYSLFFLRYIPIVKTGEILKGSEKEEEYEY